MAELWRPVEGWPYEVSNLGRVRSVPGLRRKGQVLRLSKSKQHLAITLKNQGRQRREYVHRLVLLAFVGPCQAGMEGCHADGNPENNELANLRWDTRSANHLDKNRHGTMVRGERWRQTHAVLLGPHDWAPGRPRAK